MYQPSTELQHVGYDCSYALTSAVAFRILRRTPVRFVLLDVALGLESGVDVLKAIVERYPNVPVIMITGYGTIETAVQSIKVGVYDYVQKPLDFNKLLRTAENADKLARLNEENATIKNRLRDLTSKIITQNKRMKDLVSNAERLALTDLPPTFAEAHRRESSYSPLEESERTIIVETLQRVAYNKKEAAELLRISPKTLYNKLAQYGILTPSK